VDATFLGLPRWDGEQPAEVAILGIPFGVPYPAPGLTAECSEAPGAIRARSQRLARFLAHHDFDLDGPMLPTDTKLRLVDAGDVEGEADDGLGNATRAEEAVRELLGAGAVPIVLGGDDSIPIPVLRAFDQGGPLWVVQVDAHLDFRHEVAGVRDGYSSSMRRAAELPHVERIVQVGLRGVGSARTQDVADARAAGNLLVTARELRERGVPALIGELPADASVFIAFDCDALDPPVLPAVSAPSPGGLSYAEAADVLEGIGRRCRVAGAAFTELVPSLDPNGLSVLIVVRLVMRLIGGMGRRSA
jgi:agmatinase